MSRCEGSEPPFHPEPQPYYPSLSLSESLSFFLIITIIQSLLSLLIVTISLLIDYTHGLNPNFLDEGVLVDFTTTFSIAGVLVDYIFVTVCLSRSEGLNGGGAATCAVAGSLGVVGAGVWSRVSPPRTVKGLFWRGYVVGQVMFWGEYYMGIVGGVDWWD